MKKLWFLLCLLSITLLPKAIVFAQTITDVEVKINAQKLVTITGKVTEKSGQGIQVRVIDPNGLIDYAGNIVSSKEGTFSLSYMMVNQIFGTYQVTINMFGETMPYKTEFAYGLNPSLEALMVSNGTFHETFDSNRTDYKVTLDDNSSKIQVIPVASETTSLKSEFYLS